MGFLMNPYRFAGGYDADAQAYFAQMTVQPSTAYKDAYNTMLVKLKADGNWVWDGFWIFATELQQHALINAANPTGTQITEVNFPTWIAGQGYQGDGVTSNLLTGYTPSINAVQLAQNSACTGVYSRTNVLNSNYTEFGIGNVRIACRRGADTFLILVNGSGGTSITGQTDSLGLHVGLRQDANRQYAYKNGAAFGNSLVASSPLTASEVTILSYGASLYSGRQVSLAFIGGAPADQAELYNAIQSFATTIGFNV